MKTNNFYKSRIDNLCKSMKNKNVDALVVYSRPNTIHLSGFTGTFSIILITQKQRLFFTDPRYISRVKNSITHLKVKLFESDREKFISEYSSKINAKRIGYESGITCSELKMLKKYFPHATWVDCEDIIRNNRIKKDESEIKTISKAAKIADDVMAEAIKKIKPGVTEKEIALFVKRSMEDAGAEGESFSCIIASGKNSAIPHAEPGSRKFKKGDFITLDLGAKLNGYCSDITRTVVLGKASVKQKEIYEIVKNAQETALKAVAPGKQACDIDKIARDIIAEKGYGEYFVHGTGHGVGIDIHEPPRVNGIDKTILEPGMVITIEPGIYIDGWGGVRIEDLVLVTEKGYKVLSKTPKNLIELG